MLGARGEGPPGEGPGVPAPGSSGPSPCRRRSRADSVEHSACGQAEQLGRSPRLLRVGGPGCVSGHTWHPGPGQGCLFSPHLVPSCCSSCQDAPSRPGGPPRPRPGCQRHLRQLHVPPCRLTCRPLQPLGLMLCVSHSPRALPSPTMGLDPGPSALPTPVLHPRGLDVIAELRVHFPCRWSPDAAQQGGGPLPPQPQRPRMNGRKSCWCGLPCEPQCPHLCG